MCPFLSDADECKNSSIPVCHSNAACHNTIGSFVCSCVLGFYGNGKTCQGKCSWIPARHSMKQRPKWLQMNQSKTESKFTWALQTITWQKTLSSHLFFLSLQLPATFTWQTGSKCTNHHFAPSSLPIYYSSNDQSQYRPEHHHIRLDFQASLDPEDDLRSGCWNATHYQHFFSWILLPGRSNSMYLWNQSAFLFINATKKLSEIRSGTLNNSRQHLRVACFDWSSITFSCKVSRRWMWITLM